MTAVSVLSNPEWGLGLRSGSGGSASNTSFRGRFLGPEPSLALLKTLFALDATPAGKEFGVDHASRSIANAWLPYLERYASDIGGWSQPHMSVNEMGEVTMEWWRGDKKLTVYFSERENEVLRVWGTNIEHEMDCLNLSSCRDFARHWSWLQF